MTDNAATYVPPYRKVRVIINPAAGQDRPILGVLNHAFHPHDIDWDIHLTKKAGDGTRFAAQAAKDGADVVAVHGGDGTVMEVANGLAGTGVPMAILPGGTANVMSVEMGIPIDLTQATNLIVTPHDIRTIDLGKMGDQHFMLRIGIGFEAEMMKNADSDAKARWGNIAYAVSAFQSLQTTQVSTYELTLDGEEVTIDGVSCMIANSGNLGRQGLKMAGAIEVDDGLLDVVIVRNIDLPEIASLLANALGGSESLPHWQVREVRVRVNPPQTGICDGEIFEAVDVTATVVPQALKIITPPAAAPAPAPES